MYSNYKRIYPIDLGVGLSDPVTWPLGEVSFWLGFMTMMYGRLNMYNLCLGMW